MKALEFAERTHYIQAKGRRDVPILKIKEKSGRVVLCMGFNFMERLRVLFLGRIFVCHITHNKPLQPTSYTTRRDDLFVKQGWGKRMYEYMGATVRNFGR